MPLPPFLLQLKTTIFGSSEEFPLTVRIFHSVLALSMAALVYNVPLNLYVGLPYIAIACVIMLFLIGGLYYLSRYRKQTELARTFVCATGTLLFVANYFLNSGIDGPTGYFFLLLMVAMVAIVPVRQYWFWISSNVVLMTGLHFLQYHHPQLIPYTYSKLSDRYIDINSAYFTVVVVVLMCFYIIRKSYDAERLRAEQAAAKLTELDKEKNKLFSIISHDLRSPLANIQGYLQLLSDYGMSEQETRDIQSQLLNSTSGTLEMLNNVLHWSRNQMNGRPIIKEQLNLVETLKSQVDVAVDIAKRKNIQLEVFIDPDHSVDCNSGMLQLIIRNLLNNAIKFTASGGKIRLESSISDGHCLLLVSDSGNGQPANLHESIFQLSGASTIGTANEKGVGLGLVLCRENTETMGGKIWFECDSQSGTTFFVKLLRTRA